MDALDLGFGRFVLDVAIKATALLAVTALALLVLRKASAATRHLVAATAPGTPHGDDRRHGRAR